MEKSEKLRILSDLRGLPALRRKLSFAWDDPNVLIFTL